MSEDTDASKKWLATGAAIAGLAVISPPAAGAAAITIGIEQIADYVRSKKRQGPGPVEG